ncbi:MAG: YcnI family protein [Rhizobiaceae bacterium]
MFKTLASAAGIMLAASTAAFAHATIDAKEASIGSSVRIAARIPHGCDGTPTNVVRIRVPEGFIAVKPMPKAGWELEIVNGTYETSYQYHGATLTEGVREIAWKGGELLDEHYDEFVLRGTVADTLEAGRTMYFPIVQECGDAAERWIEIPAEGQDPHSLEFPAPGMKIVPKG